MMPAPTFSAAKDFNVTPAQTIVPLVGTITEVNALGAAAAQGMILVEPFYWDLDDRSHQWSKRFFDKFGKMPNFVQAGAYSAVTNYLQAVQSTGSDDAGVVMKKLNQCRSKTCSRATEKFALTGEWFMTFILCK